MLGEPEHSEYIEELLQKSVKFFISNEIKITVHQVQVHKVAHLILLIQVIPRVVQDILRQIKPHPLHIILINLFQLTRRINSRQHLNRVNRAVNQYPRVATLDQELADLHVEL